MNIGELKKELEEYEDNTELLVYSPYSHSTAPLERIDVNTDLSSDEKRTITFLILGE